MNAKRRYTRFATLSVKKVPAGATVTVTCKGGCPRKSQTLTTAKGGTVTLEGLAAQAPEDRRHPDHHGHQARHGGMAKALTMRAERRPRIATKALP